MNTPANNKGYTLSEVNARFRKHVNGGIRGVSELTDAGIAVSRWAHLIRFPSCPLYVEGNEAFPMLTDTPGFGRSGGRCRTLRDRRKESANPLLDLIKQLDVKSIYFDVYFKNYSQTEAEEDMFLKPCLLHKQRPTVRSALIKRGMHEAMLGGDIPMYLLFASVFVSVDIDGLKENPILGYARYYLETALGGVEPYVPSAGGEISSEGFVDLMAPKRLYALYEGLCHFYYYPGVFTKEQEALLVEMIMFVFQDVYTNQTILKKIIKPYITCAFTQSTSGTGMLWKMSDPEYPNARLQSFRVVNIKDYRYNFTDDVQYDVQKPAFEEANELLEKHNLRMLKQCLQGAGDGPFKGPGWVRLERNQRNIQMVSAIFNLPGRLGGYTRSHPTKSKLEQIAMIPDDARPDMLTPRPAGPYIEAIAAEGVRWAHDRDKIPDVNTWIADVFKGLTDKSSGNYTAHATVNLGPRPDPSVRPYVRFSNDKGKSKGKGKMRDRDGEQSNRGDALLELTLNTKRVVAFVYMDQILVGAFSPTYSSWERPERSTQREVPDGKAIRFVIIVEMDQNAAEAVFTFLLDWSKTYDKNKPMTEAPNVFSAGKATGELFIDGAVYMWASSSGRVIGSASDFKTFDATQQSEILKHLGLGGAEALRALGYNSPWGISEEFSWPSLAEGMERTFSREAMQAWVLVDPSLDPVFIDMLRSGRLFTSLHNSINNFGNTKLIIDNFRRYSPEISLVPFYTQVLGDDQQTLWWRYTEWNRHVHDRLRKTVIETSHSNGFLINELDSLVSPTLIDYLKVRYNGGERIPANNKVTGRGDAERQSDLINPDSEFQRGISNYLLMASRGCDHDFLYTKALAEWCVSPQRIPTDGPAGRVYSPLVKVFLPKSVGGMGVAWGTLFQRDLLAVHYVMSEYEKGFDYLVRAWAFADHVKKGQSTLLTDIAKSIGGTTKAKYSVEFDDGLSLEPGKRYARKTLMSESRVKTSLEAKSALVNKNFNLASLEEAEYSLMPDRLATMASEGNKKAAKLRRSEVSYSYGMIGRRYDEKAAVASVIDGRESYMRYMYVSIIGEFEPMTTESPLRTTCNKFAELLKYLGPNLGGNDELEMTHSRLWTELTAGDKFVPEHNADSVFAILASVAGYDLETITQVLVYMGYDQNRVSRILPKIKSDLPKLRARELMLSASTGDPFASLYDTSNVTRYVEITDLGGTGRDDLSVLQLSFGFLMVLHYFLLFGKVYKLRVLVDDDWLVRVKRGLFGTSAAPGFAVIKRLLVHRHNEVSEEYLG